MHPSDLRFTQHSIGVSFKGPFNSTRIDDAVDMIISGEWTASTFACIHVVEVDGVLFSLDNRRLWVFRKARLSSITVKLKRANFNHPRLRDFTDNPSHLKMMKSVSFFPRVRGKLRRRIWSTIAVVNVERSIRTSWAKEHQLTHKEGQLTTDFVEWANSYSFGGLPYSTSTRTDAPLPSWEFSLEVTPYCLDCSLGTTPCLVYH